MPLFQYKAADAAGEVVQGFLEAGDRESVVAQLQALGQVPIRVELSSAPVRRSRGPLIRRRQVTQSQIVAFTRELATLLQAGLPLDRALAILANLAEEGPLAELLGGIRTRLQEGASLADALEACGGNFNRFYVNLVRAGESGGALDGVLQRLAEHLERSKEVRDTLISALLYPAILVFVALLSILLLMGYVVPQFKELFEGMGQVLPLPTRITIAVGDFVQSYGWVVIVAIAGLAWLVRRRLRSPAARYAWDQRLLRIPLVGDVVSKVEVARFARTVGTLLHNGVPLLRSLAIVKDTLGNQVIARGIEQAASAVKEGERLADPLAEVGCLPAFAVHMIRVGEESGRLEDMLLQVAEVYDRETQVALKRAMTMVEPILILVLGVVIAGVIMSILVAILGLNQLVV